MALLKILGKLRTLSAAELWLLSQAAVLLPINKIAVRAMGLTRWQHILARLALVPSPVAWLRRRRPTQHLAQALLTARIVDLAARRGLSAANCLQRSLALWWLLKRQGVDADVKIGVRLVAQRCEAHAWVEYLGCVLNDSTDVYERFAPFAGAIFTAEVESS